MASLGSRLVRTLGRLLAGATRSGSGLMAPGRCPASDPRAAARPGPGSPDGGQGGRGESSGAEQAERPAYSGDFVGTPPMDYTPVDDDLADPGEVVWAWVPYEEDHSRGKDRPVLVIGRHAGLLLALPLTSKDHDRDADQEASQGRHWCDVGAGGWDRRGRPSEVRVDRVLQLDPSTVRRIGAVLPRERFDQVAQAVRAHR